MRRKLLTINNCGRTTFTGEPGPLWDLLDGRMSDNESIEIASRRLSSALDALEAAADRRRELDLGQEALFTQLHALGTDRARLASDLDETTARARGLETATREIAAKVDRAIETIRSVLDDDK
jgi:predicted transcriptional regulator